MEFKDYGLKGIDTQLERDIIDYRPVIQYLAETLHIEDVSEERPSVDLAKAILYRRSLGLERAERISMDIAKVIEDIYSLFSNITVEDITAQAFDAACRSVSPEAKQTAIAYIEKSNIPEASIYPHLIDLQLDVLGCAAILSNESKLLQNSTGFYREEDLFSYWHSEERALKRLQSEISTINSRILDTTELQREIRRLNSEIREKQYSLSSLRRNPAHKINEIVHMRLDLAAAEIEHASELMTYNIVQLYNREISSGIKTIISAMPIRGIKDYTQQIAKVRQIIANIKTLLDISSNLKIRDMFTMPGPHSNPITSSVVKSATSIIMTQIAKLRVSILDSVEEWLAELSDGQGFDVDNRLIDILANTIIDVMEIVENNFNEAVNDFVLIAEQEKKDFSNRVKTAIEVKRSNQITELLDRADRILAIMSPSTFSEFVLGKRDWDSLFTRL